MVSFCNNINPFISSFIVGDNASLKRSFEFLRLEMPVRLANIMQEIHLLPDKLLNTPSGKLVLEMLLIHLQLILLNY